MENFYYAPSFLAHVINGFLILFSCFFVYAHFDSIQSLDQYKKLVLLLLFAVVIGIHSLSHLGLETVYNFNPLLVFM